MMSAMEILDPVGSTSATSRTLAPRPASLAGKVIGVLDNSKPNARVLLEGVARALARAASGPARCSIWRKPGAVDRRHPAVLDEIAARAARPHRLRRLRVVHVVEYPRRGGAGRAGDRHRRARHR